MDARKTLGWRGQPSVHVIVPQSSPWRPVDREDVPANAMSGHAQSSLGARQSITQSEKEGSHPESCA